MDILIVGGGYVGKEHLKLFPNAEVYDPYKDAVDGKFTLKKPPKKEVDFAFICVPTPMKEDGSCDLKAFHKAMREVTAKVYVIRSTITPGTTALYYNAVFQPEYVASSSPYPAPLGDVSRRTFIILGGEKEYTKKVRRLYEGVYSPTVDIMETSSITAELIKLCENTSIAAKVTLCQEFYEICKVYGIDYDELKQGVFGLDPRFNLWFTNVYPDKRGFSNSHCLPKDLNNLVHDARKKGYKAEFIEDILKNNKRWKNET